VFLEDGLEEWIFPWLLAARVELSTRLLQLRPVRLNNSRPGVHIT